MLGFQSFYQVLHHFVLAKLATAGIWVEPSAVLVQAILTPNTLEEVF